MDAVCERTLKIILESAIETPDGFLFSKDIGIRGDERKRVCGYLLQHGYITQTELDSLPEGSAEYERVLEKNNRLVKKMVLEYPELASAVEVIN